jgi:hypothetical protein
MSGYSSRPSVAGRDFGTPTYKVERDCFAAPPFDPFASLRAGKLRVKLASSREA